MSDAARAGALALALDADLAGGFVQDVRIGGPELVVLALRQPGRSACLALSVLPRALGACVLDEVPAQHPGDGLLTGLRDLLRAHAIGARLERVALMVRDGAQALRFDTVRSSGEVVLVLEISGRGNLEVHRPDAAPQALHPPAGALVEPEPAPPHGAPPVKVLEEERSRLENLRTRVLHERRLADLRQRVRRSLAGARRLVERRTDDVERLGDAGPARRDADALAASLHRLARGQGAIDVEWQGETLRLVLDPARSAGENLRRAYSRAARAERGATEAGGRLEEARTRLSDVEALDRSLAEPRLDDAAAAGELAALEADARRLLRPAREQAPPARRGMASSGPREYVSKDGFPILVGRSAAGNDELTFRIARGNDVWLHSRGIAGAHVVLRLPKGSEIPPESLLDAATLAHLGSKLAKEPRGEITWCRVKDVSKRRGMAPGQVQVARERVIALRVEPARVARLEASGAREASE